MEWFQQWFGDDYLVVYEHRDEEEAKLDVDAIEQIIGFEKNDLILDLCCGAGRHAFPIVDRGCRVIGLDYSKTLLKIAQESRTDTMRFPYFVRADARKFPFRVASFDIVLNLFTSYGYFGDDENRMLLHSIASVLKPDGKFYIDYLNPPRVLANLVKESYSEKDGCEILEKREYDPKNSRIEKVITITRDGRSQEFCESVHLYELQEMLAMLDEAGLRAEPALGSPAGEPYNESSDRMILHGRS